MEMVSASKTGPCPKGFENHDEDESGTCWPKTPKTPCPPNSHRVGNHCEPDCPKGTHFTHFPFKCIPDNCPNGFHYVNGKCVRTIVVHKTVVKHITSNSDENFYGHKKHKDNRTVNGWSSNRRVQGPHKEKSRQCTKEILQHNDGRYFQLLHDTYEIVVD